MTARGKEAAALALHRFGFGAGRDSIAAIANDPRGAFLADLDRPSAGQLANADLLSSGQAARTLFDFRAEQTAKQKLEQRAKKVADVGGCAPDAANNQNSNVQIGNVQNSEGNPFSCSRSPVVAAPAPPNQPPQPPQIFIQNEARARFDTAIDADVGFVERLVWFWSNHFCVSADKIPSMVGAYEREAIRPHALGRFGDLLLAVESHPAMLFYLDNVQSMGAASVAGINRDKGLNENLARETMELHSLGVHGGYTQKDVTSFANVLTGWSWIQPGEPDHGGEFAFIKRLHEPGEQTVLGKRYPDAGVEQGRAVLADLARHPATAAHIADKLARHFVSDEPPATLVTKLTQRFKDTDGDLKEVAKTLITAGESWSPQRQKLKTPAIWMASMLRLVSIQAVPPNAIGRILGAQALLGEALWRPPAPNGYPDTEAAWIDGVPHRLDIANEFAVRVGANADPLALLDSGLGPLASADTRATIARAESRIQALALLVMSPEFLRS